MLPSFVLAVPGPWIAVHGDVGWVVQALTDLVNLQCDLYDTGVLNIAHLFLALHEPLKEPDPSYKGQETPTLWPRSVHMRVFDSSMLSVSFPSANRGRVQLPGTLPLKSWG